MHEDREHGVQEISVIDAMANVDLPIPMLILERGLHIRWINRAALEQLGRHAEDLIDRSWYDLFPGSRARIEEHRRLFSGELAALDLNRIPLKRACATPRFFSLRLRPIREPDGSIQNVIGIGEDVTVQVEAEQALRDNEERFRAMSMHARDMIIVSGRDGAIKYANSAVGSILGRHPDTRVGASMFEHMHPDDVPRAAAAFTRLVGDPSIGMVEDIELRKRHEDGSWRWLQITATNLLDHPQVGGILLNCRDVTDHKQAEFALAQTQARLDAALWGARVGLYTIDLVEDRAHMSPQFFEITGIDPIEWQADAHPWKSRIHPRDLPNVIRLLQAHIAGALDAFDTEYRLRTPQGWMWVLDRARVTERAADGRALTLSGTVIDISARKRLERELVEIVNREQLRLSQELHDGLGQELTGIALLLRSALVPGARKSAATDKTVDLAVAHLNNSIRTARTLAYGLYPVSSDQGGLLGALKTLAENSTQPRALQVNFDTSLWVQRALPDDVANHIYRIAQEALGNAMRHARGSQVLIQLAALPDALTLRVRDNGRGLPDRALHAPGLGRRIMTYRAQMIGGSIEWVSPAGGGTEVLLSVPWPAFAPV